MSEKEKFLIIKKCIDQMDCYDLLAGGAPADEFDAESREISKRVRPDQSAQEIADIIASVFNDAFGAQDESALFMIAAERIKNGFLAIALGRIVL